jgi:uncharacterized membrane protein YbhN (UPF0104 family)
MSARTWLRRLGPLITIALFIIAIAVLYHELKVHDVRDVVRSVRSIPVTGLLLGTLLTAGSYIVLTGYDYLGFWYLGHLLPYRRIALAAFVGYAFSNTIGHAPLSGGSVRYRLYSSWGLTTLEISKLIVFNLVTFYLGMVVLAGGLMLLAPARIAAMLRVDPLTSRIIGCGLLALVVAYLGWLRLRARPIVVRKVELPLPTLRLSMAQIGTVWLELVLAGSVLFALLPPEETAFLPGETTVTWPGFIAAYLVALTAGYMSQVPGGLGVFESIMITLMSSKVAEPAMLSALLAYRVIYFILPLAGAAAMMGLFELRDRATTRTS